MNASIPAVSILMGIYNCETTLAEAIDSIRAQTFTDWEFIICDDGSKDGSLMLANDYALKDPRIKVIRNEKNIGLAQTLDHCASVARGKYFARMDGDDRCDPARLQKLFSTIESHPNVAVVSSWMSMFDEHGTWGLIRTRPEPTAADFADGTPICHAPCMMRRSAFEAVGGYGSQPWVIRTEDYYLWFRFYAKGFRALNLQEPLYHMRDDRAAKARRTFKSRINETIVRWKGFGLLGYPLWKRIWAIRPILVWATPSCIYEWLRRKNRR
jgi:glycosyltransferase EpsE